MTQPKLFVLIGVPGSGKSTWTKQYLIANPDTIVVSSDDIIQKFADEHGLTYNQAFKECNQNDTEKQMFGEYENAIKNESDIIIDRTNMSKKSRSKFLSKIPRCYQKIAINFDIPNEVIKERLESRKQATGKDISWGIVARMLSNYEAPDLDEFDVIRLVKS